MTHSSSAVWLMMTEGTKTLWQTVLLQYLCTHCRVNGNIWIVKLINQEVYWPISRNIGSLMHKSLQRKILPNKLLAVEHKQ